MPPRELKSLTDTQFPDHYLRLRTNDLSEARSIISSAYDSHVLQPHQQTEHFNISLHHVAFNSVSLSVVNYASDVTVKVNESTGFYVLMPLQGDLEVHVDNEKYFCQPGAGLIINSGQAFDKIMRNNYTQLVVRFEAETVQQYLQDVCQLPANVPLRFQPQLVKNSPSSQSWQRAVQYVLDELRTTDLSYPHQLISKPLEQLLIQSLLRCQPSNYFQTLIESSQRQMIPWYVKKAIEYMRSNTCESLNLESLAEITGVSSRSLQYGFKKAKGVSPIQYLKTLRLEQVRDALLNAGVDDSVTPLAMAAGFRQLGRFAHIYKEHYGESPSETLQRTINNKF